MLTGSHSALAERPGNSVSPPLSDALILLAWLRTVILVGNQWFSLRQVRDFSDDEHRVSTSSALWLHGQLLCLKTVLIMVVS